MQVSSMSVTKQKRATIYLDPELHRTAKAKASLTSTTISKLISDALKESLKQDIEDLQALEATKDESSFSLEEVLKDLNLEHLQ